jgi:hypothetical protein
MPKLDGTHLPSRLESRLSELRAGKEVAARDIRVLLTDEQIAEMDAAWAAQQELRKKRRARTKEEEQALGWKTKRDIYIEAYERALKAAQDSELTKALEAENTKLKKLLANSMLEIDAMREVLKGK